MAKEKKVPVTIEHDDELLALATAANNAQTRTAETAWAYASGLSDRIMKTPLGVTREVIRNTVKLRRPNAPDQERSYTVSILFAILSGWIVKPVSFTAGREALATFLLANPSKKQGGPRNTKAPTVKLTVAPKGAEGAEGAAELVAASTPVVVDLFMVRATIDAYIAEKSFRTLEAGYSIVMDVVTSAFVASGMIAGKARKRAA